MRLDTEELLLKYQNDIFRASFIISKNYADAEDVTQETFLRYYRSRREFDSESHIRAWLLRTAMNLSKDLLKSFFRKSSVPLEEYADSIPFESPSEKIPGSDPSVLLRGLYRKRDRRDAGSQPRKRPDASHPRS